MSRKYDFDKDKLASIIWLSELFRRYYENGANDKEREVVRSWNPEKDGQPDIRFLKPDAETEKNWRSIASELGLKNQSKKTWAQAWAARYAAAAAVFLLVAAGFYITMSKTELLQSGNRQYFASGSDMKKIELPDGSVVLLNDDTRLSVIKDDFNKNKREVWLEEGEAFFEVAHNPEKPFVVHTHTIMTTVKGTSFNIKAYKELDENVLSVRTGKVEVSLDEKIVGSFTKNRRMTYRKSDGHITKDEISWEDAAAWIEGRLVMKRANTNELKLRIKQHFGLSLEIRGDALKGTLLNVSFEKDVQLEKVLKGISKLYDVKYSIENDKVILYK